jgi:hypothetical protein
MWRIPVGTQIPVEVVSNQDVSIYHQLKYAHLEGIGAINVSQLFPVPNTLYKVVSMRALMTDGAAQNCVLRLSIGGNIVWEMWHPIAALAGGSIVTYCDLGSNTRIINTAAFEAYSMIAPPWFDNRFILEFNGNGTTAIDIVWYEEYRTDRPRQPSSSSRGRGRHNRPRLRFPVRG